MLKTVFARTCTCTSTRGSTRMASESLRWGMASGRAMGTRITVEEIGPHALADLLDPLPPSPSSTSSSTPDTSAMPSTSAPDTSAPPTTTASSTSTTPPPPTVHLFDVREPYEWESTGVIPGAVLTGTLTDDIKWDEVIPGIDKENDVIVAYCKVGVRSLHAAATLQGSGFKRVKSLRGGIIGWVGSGYELERVELSDSGEE
ncbi:Rhodanese-like protein [Gonapodya prolifera JEL478]|uniref:Rhodanese-like protein n=1 Tax=Gonapodya prolifera (strain JEL478) TaxID=1344416 RepID=A0A139A5R8_GONPJ|nr:Rhodanese-like protein [Gonapodya prolifera JEL478]|eukprot:KXS11998.1 Rhodanese-like protein [Gonapodya prolifera JEL478]